MRVLCVFGQHNYGDPRRGEGYEYANFIPALRRLGHDVLFLDSWDRTKHPDFASLNRRLLELVEEEQPDVILSVIFTYEIWLETLELLRNSGTAVTVNWVPDDSWKYSCSSRFLAPAFHAFATTYPSALARYEKDGIGSAMLTQWAADAGTLRDPLPAVNCRYPVSFIGTAHGERPRWIRALRQRGIDVACFGHGWPAGPLAGPEIPEIIRGSVISLNFSNATRVWEGFKLRHTHQVKARTFEVPGAGGFLLTQWAEGLERYYVPDREIVLFHDVDELAMKIRYFLAHPLERDAIARAGFERTRSHHIYDQRLREVLDFALRRRASVEAGGAGRWQNGIDWGAFERAVERHRRDGMLGLVKTLLSAPFSFVWGPTRGERAARRILFELSWRLAGRHTYSAAGWPGRLFYEVS